MKPVDKFGREIFPFVFRKLEAIGAKLESLGYKEAKSKPNLFLRNSRIVTFFADMRGTEIIPIWDEPVPLFYWKWNSMALPLPTRQNAVYIEGKSLELKRVPVRFSNEQNYENHEEALRLYGYTVTVRRTPSSS
ncbi:MAG: hypothetical protein AAGU11_21095 [Syntrophobacteraceae bacterium]